MSFGNGPRVVTNGLVLSVDANDYNSHTSGSSTWSDVSGYSNTITNGGSPGPFFGSTGSLTYFDYSANLSGSVVASYAFTDFGSAINNTLATASFTFEMWISRDSSSVAISDRESLFTNTGTGGGFRFQLSAGSGPQQLYYLIGGSNGAGFKEGPVGSGYLTYDGKWTQVIMVYDRLAQLGSYNVYAYTNGVFRGSVAQSSAITSSFVGSAGVVNPGISLGCCSSFKGKVSKLSVYNRALTAQEVLQNYTAIKSRFNLT